MPIRSRLIVDAVTTVAIWTACTVLVVASWSRIHPAQPPAPPVPPTPVSLAGAAVRGNPAASVVVVEYGDYQCPFCAAAERQTVPALATAYVEPGKVQLAFRQHPLEELHPLALEASEAAVCAERQGQFWQMHAALYADQRHLDEPSLLARAGRLGLDLSRFKACLAGGEALGRIREEARGAEDLGLTATPAFLVGVRQPDGSVRATAVLVGARPVAEFRKVIDPLLGAGGRPRGAAWWLWPALLGLAGAIGVLGTQAWRAQRGRRAPQRPRTA
jgi:protein-disulfide isomerase